MKKAKATRKPSSILTDVIAENVRAFREARGLSQEDFAHISGLHRTYVGAVERGERNVTLATLEMLASTMGCSVAQILTKKAIK